MSKNTHNLVLVALALGMLACSGGAAAPTTEVTPPRTTASHARHSRFPEGPFTGPQYDGDHSLPGDPVAGELVFTTTCLPCHGADGRGNGGMTGADFIDDHSRLAKNNETLLRSITEGIPNSPPMPSHRAILTEVQIRDALSYLRVHFGGTPAPDGAELAPAADAAALAAAPTTP